MGGGGGKLGGGQVGGRVSLCLSVLPACDSSKLGNRTHLFFSLIIFIFTDIYSSNITYLISCCLISS